MSDSNAINKSETKPCKCGKKMIRLYSDPVFLSNPTWATWDWYCGGCKTSEYGGNEMLRSDDEILQERWEAAQ